MPGPIFQKSSESEAEKTAGNVTDIGDMPPGGRHASGIAAEGAP
jgi:hypothetical protein